MIAAHVGITCSPDYLARREPHRRAHIERLLALREAGALVGGGPAPDGRTADLVYRVPDLDRLAALVDEDPYRQAGAWTGYLARPFATFVDPWESPPVVLDGSRRVTVVEGPAADAGLAELALVELRGAARLAFGGLLGGGRTLAVLRSPDPAEAAAWLAGTGCWEGASLVARPLLHVL
jgi:hypothetical protein